MIRNVLHSTGKKWGIHYESHLLRLICFQRIWNGLLADMLMWLRAAIKVLPQ